MEVFSTAYLAPIPYYKALLQSENPFFEKHESWVKQTYRNRTYIDSPNGALMLNIPIQHKGNNTPINEVEISYTTNWHLKHWQAIKTTYNSSPFFEVLGPELLEIYEQKETSLFEFNLSLNTLILNWLQIKITVKNTNNWQDIYDVDYRNSFSPKQKEVVSINTYPQVFQHKHGFLPQLSIIDLLFNEGPASYDYLKRL